MRPSLLILGANGFIGSHLTERVLADGSFDLVALDLESTRLGAFGAERRFQFVQADIVADFERVDKLIERADVVVPLVAIATPQSYVRDPLRVFELTFEANLRVVRSAVRYQKRIVFASSSEVYGMCDSDAFEEEVSPLVVGPIEKHRWIYACSKQLLDRVIHAYGLQRGLQYTIFRPFNWIGGGLDDPYDSREGSSRVLTQFIGNVLRGENIRLVNGGQQRRCFLYVDDAIDCLARILENRGGCADQQIFNVGNPDAEITIGELARRVIKLARGYPGVASAAETVRCVDVEADAYYGRGYQDMERRKPSIRKVRSMLGWTPTTDLDTALRKTVDVYFRTAGARRSAAVPACLT
jgi:nucleoside-diphosphate-sugar epimerase